MNAPKGRGRPRSTQRDERGAAALELALFLPVMALLIALGVGATGMVSDQNHLNQVTETAARFATRAADDPVNPGPYGTRPTPAAVAAYVEEISELPVVEVTVTPDPNLAFPGDDVTVAVTLQHDVGPLGHAANALAGLMGRDPVFPEGEVQMRSAVTMRKE